MDPSCGFNVGREGPLNQAATIFGSSAACPLQKDRPRWACWLFLTPRGGMERKTRLSLEYPATPNHMLCLQCCPGKGLVYIAQERRCVRGGAPSMQVQGKIVISARQGFPGVACRGKSTHIPVCDPSPTLCKEIQKTHLLPSELQHNRASGADIVATNVRCSPLGHCLNAQSPVGGHINYLSIAMRKCHNQSDLQKQVYFGPTVPKG